MRRGWIAAAIAATLLGGCERERRQGGNPAPPKVEAPADLPSETSTIVVPLTIDLAALEAGLNARVPRQLWQIDRFQPKCVAAKRVKVLGVRAKVTPDIGCRIVGQVTRGRIRLSGKGQSLIATLPVSAVIAARNVGGVLKGETATGAAEVRATVRLAVDRAWQPTAKVDIAYDWTEPPGIDFLGQRIKFAEKADAKLKGVIAGLERSLPQELAKLHARARIEQLWRQAFTAIELNREKPPAWMRVTPKRLGFGGYRVAGRRLEMTLQAEALTETFVGGRPPDPAPTPLPPPATRLGPRGLRFFVPVLADYAQLEPVVHRALVKRAARGITLKGVGPVEAEFGKVTVYATEGGRLAVGVKAKVRARSRPELTTTHGEVWLWGVPYNEPNSQVVRVRDLSIAGETDRQAVDMLIQLFLDPGVLAEIRESLTHDFAPDYQRVLTAARKAIAGRREGDFLLSANVSDVSNGEIRVTGQGLFLPVRAKGTAAIRYSPATR
ncbi:DUF4403 family protein [Sphingomonas cannabina]|uniref:DUF4403 family protein n=1 Tax=Sphingomonas cannabina TaxID=2899123 RepID=UPI001F297BF6|nr:DUF4403 family protein [Sphingomonas cannabina]UIJ44574.1 DUF4403 family protein [Sphingomonas cannabina]